MCRTYENSRYLGESVGVVVGELVGVTVGNFVGDLVGVTVGISVLTVTTFRMQEL